MRILNALLAVTHGIGIGFAVVDQEWATLAWVLASAVATGNNILLRYLYTRS